MICILTTFFTSYKLLSEISEFEICQQALSERTKQSKLKQSVSAKKCCKKKKVVLTIVGMEEYLLQ